MSRLFLEIPAKRGAKLYLVTLLDPDPRVAVKAWRLTQEGGKSYDVSVCKRGWLSCTCADAVYRTKTCKHAQALQEMGLLPRKS